MRTYTRRSADQWQALVNEQRESSLSAPEFCKQQNLGYASFCQWRKRLQETTSEPDQQTPSFVVVDSPHITPVAPQWIVELEVSADIVLRIAKQ